MFRLSLSRMLLLVALIGFWLAGVRVLPVAWGVWLTTATFYLGVVLCCRPAEAD